jgi:hypothetical protein
MALGWRKHQLGVLITLAVAVTSLQQLPILTHAPLPYPGLSPALQCPLTPFPLLTSHADGNSALDPACISLRL